jgi:GT2 family glycosyltransferase
MTEPYVSIIIVNYNGAHHLHECLTSIQEIDYPDHEVVMVDNASSDDSIPFVKENFPFVRIISLSRNYGFAEGSNIGAKNSKGEYVVFLNNDTKVDKKWLSELVKEIIRDNSIAACGSKMLFYDGNRINHAGASITLLGNAYDIGFGQEDNGKFDQKRFVGSTCGGSMILRKKVFDLLGGFDPEYFACSEDVDICLRAWIYGFKNMYVPASIVYHKYGETLGKRQSAWRIYFCQKNRLVNILKNFETINIIKSLIISIPYDCVRMMIFLSFMETRTAFSLIKANIDVLAKMNRILQKRKIIQRKRRMSDSSIIKMGIITPLTDGIREFARLNRLRDN